MPNVIEVGIAFWDEVNKIHGVEGEPQIFQARRRAGEQNWSLGQSFQLRYTTAVTGHWRVRGFECILHSRFCRVDKPAVDFIPDKAINKLINVRRVMERFVIPCEEVIWLVDIEVREGGEIMEGLDIAFADNSTNGNISTLHNEIEGVGMSSFLLDSMGSRHQPLAMEHHLSSLGVLEEIPYLCKPK